MNITSDNEANTPNAPSASSFFMVGLGASAGGIQALQSFFENMPVDSGMAFVVIMHLSPEHESHLAQVLQVRTSMPVLQVNEQTVVQPNHVYVIPPNKHLALRNGYIELIEPQQTNGKRLAIDLFFRTLASVYGPRAMAIVLSGSDGDGAIGIKHIKEQGGITLAQEPGEAEFDSMPRTAISTGMVDWVLPAAQMPAQIMQFLRNEVRMHVPSDEDHTEADTQADDRNSGGPLTIHTEESAGDEEALVEVLRFVHAQTGHDFAFYKRATILRRVARRLQVNLLETIPAYLDFLRTHPSEAIALLHDLLISVTNFFRDTDAFAALESQIPQLFADKAANNEMRAWVAGCATGEEAYSIAMLLVEYATQLESPPTIQVFATDLDESAIQIARSGQYPATIEADVSPERLRRFFYKEEGTYRIKKELRERVLFSAHNLLTDSPFSRLDLVSCRNLLIYLKRQAQEGILDLFHFALRHGGLMFLGSAENVANGHNLFAPLDKSQRLFVRRPSQRAAWQLPTFQSARPAGPVLSSPRLPPAPSKTALEEDSSLVGTRRASFGGLHLSLLEQFAPPSVVINADYDIVHLSEHATRFLQMAGDPSLNLLQVVHPALRGELRTALYQAAHEHSRVTTPPFRFDTENGPRLIALHIRPTQGTDTDRSFLVVFDLQSEPIEAVTPPTTPPTLDTVTRMLEEENQHLRRQLNATVEQYEASLEELRAGSEEQQSINEEMRSTAEELETSKEELQSTNEELITVNQELKSNLNDLSRANGDLQNLMASTEIGTIFLNRQLCIQRFTPRIRELFNIISTDVGRPLSDITHKFNYENFTEDAEQVVEKLARVERELESAGHTFLARLLPYRTLDDHIDGVVLTFIDITERKKAEEALRESEEVFRRAIEEAPIPIIMHAEDGQVLQISRTWTELTGYTAEEMVSFHAWLNAAYGEGADVVRAHMQKLFNGQERRLNLDFFIKTRGGETRYWNFSSSVPGTLRDGRRFIIGMAIDITERKQYQDNIASLNQQLKHNLTETHHRVKNNLQVAAALIDLVSQTDTEIIAADDVRRVQQHIQAMANMHDLLTQEVKADATAYDVSAQGLMEKLAPLLQKMVGSRPLRFDIEDVRLPMKVGTTLCILINELVTNAAKHGEGIIELTLKVEGEEGKLTVCDEGSGFPPGFDPHQAAHTGLELVGGVSALDLGGEVLYQNRVEGGACVTVTFGVSS